MGSAIGSWHSRLRTPCAKERLLTIILIKRTTDTYRCEDCGSAIADGAKVYFDGELRLNLEPIAHCYDDVSYDDEDIARHILGELGMSVVYSSEDDYCRRQLRSLGHEIQIA